MTESFAAGGAELERSATLSERYAQDLDILGRDRAVRSLVMTMFLTTRYHLVSRPISSSNTSFYLRLARSTNSLLDVLNGPGWEPLAPQVEEAFGRLRALPETHPSGKELKELAWDFRRQFRTRFHGLSQPWSHVPPAEDLSLQHWPTPRNIMVAVGPNIGIGDELIFFQLLDGLALAYPEANLRVSSHVPDLWSLHPAADRVVDSGDDQLRCFVEARLLLEEDPEALIVFVEFASAPIYRQLEGYTPLRRFAYLDTGASCVRLVDHLRGVQREKSISRVGGVYQTMPKMLKELGLPPAKPGEKILRKLAPPSLMSRPRRVFLNPFSSKDYRALSPEWWCTALARAASECPFELELFCGITAESRDFAEAIRRGLSENDSVRVLTFGDSCVETIRKTLEEAARCDVAFGLDTFTSHIGVLSDTPAFSILFGSEWEFWKTREASSLYAYVQYPPELVGAHHARLLAPVSDAMKTRAERFSVLTREAEELVGDPSSGLDQIRSLWDQFEREVRAWVRAEPEIAELFCDSPVEYATSLRASITMADELSPGVRSLVSRGLQAWRDCNAHRLLAHQASQ